MAAQPRPLLSRPALAARPRIAVPLLATLATLVALAFAGCGSADDGTPVDAGSDPEQVLDVALGGGGDPISSGVLDLSFKLDSTAGQAGSVQASVSGPFVSNGDGQLPDLDFEISAGADVGGPSLSFAGGLILTADGLWVNYQDEDYQLDAATFERVKDSYAKSAALEEDEDGGGSLAQFGVDPQDWLTDVSNEGTEDIDGTETVHISGRGDVKRIVSDLDAIAAKSGQQQLGGSEIDQLESSVKGAEVDVYAATADGSLRRIDVALDLADGSVTFSIGIGDPNSEQEISAPTEARPLDELLSRFLGSAAGGGASPGAGGGSAEGDDAYFQCVQQAPSPDAVADCARYLQ